MAGKTAKKRARKRRTARGTTPPVIGEIKLKTLPEAMDTFEKIIGAFNSGKMKREKFTALVYALNSYANFLMSREESFFERLSKLEKLMQERGLYDSTKSA